MRWAESCHYRIARVGGEIRRPGLIKFARSGRRTGCGLKHGQPDKAEHNDGAEDGKDAAFDRGERQRHGSESERLKVRKE